MSRASPAMPSWLVLLAAYCGLESQAKYIKNNSCPKHVENLL